MQAGSSCIGKWRVVRMLDAGRELLYRKVASRESPGCKQCLSPE
jgi:hypothetical protein